LEVRKVVQGAYVEMAIIIGDEVLRGNVKTERITCRYCGSDTVLRYGKNRRGVQRYKCPKCKKVFLDVDALPRMRIEVKHLGDVIGQYYGGMSLKELRRQFEQQHNVPIARSSFDRWLTKFSKIAVDTANEYHPKVGSKWIADECVLKIDGRNVWCWDIIDADTRFLLATHLSYTRTTKDAKELMEKAARVAGKTPKVVITDSLRAYIDGIELAFGSETKHIQSKPFAEADISTNKIERWHSTLRTREGIMRGLKSLDTAQALLDGWLVHYNYFRPHESLDDVPPGEAAGVKLPFKTWLDVIESQRVKIQPETIELDSEQDESDKPLAHKPQAKRKFHKTKRISKRGKDTELREIRG
jgi:transposase-like protein/predicted RNA-binding Zn-ribbon protein involved in translation (DUF1610 family)